MLPRYLGIYSATIRKYRSQTLPTGEFISEEENVTIIADGFDEAVARANEYITFVQLAGTWSLGEVRAVVLEEEAFAGAEPEPVEEKEIYPDTAEPLGLPDTGILKDWKKADISCGIEAKETQFFRELHGF